MKKLLLYGGWFFCFPFQMLFPTKLPHLIPLYPETQVPFFTFRTLDPIEKEIFDIRPDVGQTRYNFSVYSHTTAPLVPVFVQRVEQKLFTSLPSFSHLEDQIPTTNLSFLHPKPLPWPRPVRKPIQPCEKDEQNTSIFEKNPSVFSQTGSTGLTSHLRFGDKENAPFSQK